MIWHMHVARTLQLKINSGSCALTFSQASICSPKMGGRRPRISFSTHAKAENQGRHAGAPPSAQNCSQKLGAHRPRSSYAARTLQLKINGAVTAPFHGHQIVVKSMGARRPRTSSSTRVTAENQRRGHCALPQAANRIRQMGDAMSENRGHDHRVHRRQTIAKSLVHGNRALHAARTLQFKTARSPRLSRGIRSWSKNGRAATSHFIQHARYGRKSRVRSPRPSIGTTS